MHAVHRVHAVIDNRVNFPCRVVTPYTCVPSEIAFLCIGCQRRATRTGGYDSICTGISTKILITFEVGALPPFASEERPTNPLVVKVACCQSGATCSTFFRKLN